MTMFLWWSVQESDSQRQEAKDAAAEQLQQLRDQLAEKTTALEGVTKEKEVSRPLPAWTFFARALVSFIVESALEQSHTVA